MKKLLVFFLFAGCLYSCQTKPQQYFTASPEIDLIKKANAAYVAGDWKTMRSVYSDTCKVWDNVWDPAQALSVDPFIKALQATIENYSEYKIADDAIYEMVVTDTGEKWVHNWFLWSGKHKNGAEVKIPIHLSFRVVNEKVAFQANMYNVLPAYLADNPQPVADAETVK